MDGGQRNAGELAKLNDQIGSLDNALAIVKRAASKNPADMRLKQLLIKFSVEKGQPEEALKVAVEAAHADPTSWRIQRSLARLRKTLNAPVKSVRGHYEAAIRHHKGDVGLVVELGAYLFTRGEYEEAIKVFETVRNLSLSGQERTRIREVWRGADNKPIVFEGKVKRLAGAIGTVIATPENFEAFFGDRRGQVCCAKEMMFSSRLDSMLRAQSRGIFTRSVKSVGRNPQAPPNLIGQFLSSRTSR